MKAICIGGATVDSIATIDSDHIERMSMLNAETSFLLLEEGRKTEALDISTHCGGGAINAAVALARLGLETGVLVKLGPDARADFILARLTAEGISPRWIVRDDKAPTGASVIISSHERNAAVFTFRGANALLTPRDIASEAFNVDLAYIAGLPGRSGDCFPHIIAEAKAAGALVAVNAGVRQLSAHAQEFFDSASKIDVLTLNRREAETLLPGLVARFGEYSAPRIVAPVEQPALLRRGLVGGGYEMPLPAFFSTLRALGPRYVMLTDGSGGAFVGSDAGILYCPAGKANVASTAGAGDAMAATFAALITMGYATEVALKAATLNAASVVAHIDTQSGLLRRDALEARLDAHADLKLRKWKLAGTTG